MRILNALSRPLNRLVVVTGGAYAAVSLIAMMLARLPLPASEAIPAAALIGLALFPILIICGFVVKELRHLLVGLTLAIGLLGLAAFGAFWW
jgi:hypothetical protein